VSILEPLRVSRYDVFTYTRKERFCSKILLDTDLKIILLGQQNNFVGILKIMLQKVLIF